MGMTKRKVVGEREKKMEWSTKCHAPVVQKVDKHYPPVDNAIGFPNTYPLDSNYLSGG